MAVDWMIYGAYGYTGRLTVLAAREQGLQPLICGRAAGPLTRIAAESGCRHKAIDLGESARLRRNLADISVVLNCAGPFAQTAKPLIDACLETGTHYLDITGEIDVFNYAQSRHQDAVDAGIVLCPGVGFDVVPTDCLAATLSHAMPDATHLTLGFDSSSRLSPGTAKTSVSKLPSGGRIRRDGEIVQVPLAYHTREIDFGNGTKLAMTIPWGDIATAYHTTGIGNIETYIPASEKLIKRMRLLNKLRRPLGWSWVQRRLYQQIDKKVIGPDRDARHKSPMYVWGEVRNGQGNVRSARVRTANGYALTVVASVHISRHLLEQSVEPGYYTPSRLMGNNFVSLLPGSSNIEIT